MADVIVGRFALIDPIAKGGSGSVWRAWDLKKQALCAAKVLRQRDSADLMRFVREKGVAFDHPHLLAPYGWGAEDEHVVIAMPLVTGGTLESLVRLNGPLSEPAAVVVLDQLLDGLELMHSQGWIHRDVKPANLMFEATGTGRPHTRLADFGIAVHESDVRFTHVGMVNGTPGYMAPELFDLADPVPSHDVYAAGMVALMALNGKIALHDGALRPDELAKHLQPASPKLAAVLRRMLAATPRDRFQDVASVRRALPRVPAGYPLTFANGRPFAAPDTLPPLPPGAPGAMASRPSGPAAPIDRARRGELPGARGASTLSPATGAPPQGRGQAGPQGRAPGAQGSPQTGQQGPAMGAPMGAPSAHRSAPQQGMPPGTRQSAPTGAQRPGPQGQAMRQGAPGQGVQPAGQGQGMRQGVQGQGAQGRAIPTGMQGRSPVTGPQGSTAAHGGARRSSRGRTVAIAVTGVLVAIVAGVLIALAIMRLTGSGSSSAEDTPPPPGVIRVDAGQECQESEVGRVGVTAEDVYVSCAPQGDGSYTY
ncbi:serine/threonine protein kinase [Brachybacterium huguangmaarense]